MTMMTIEQGRVAYWADFAFYGASIVALAVTLMIGTPHAQWAKLVLWVLTGVVGWSVLEYLVHRFVFHGIQPFRRWHAEHHARPTAFICAPTIVTASILGGFLFLAAWLIGDVFSAGALMLGVLCGYLAYSTTHHAIHHWQAKGAWLRRRQRLHFVHHHARHPCCYGVTSGFWDAACGSTRPDRQPTAGSPSD
jgi:cyclopropane-fatty-acyl-phospholipid synthase